MNTKALPVEPRRSVMARHSEVMALVKVLRQIGGDYEVQYDSYAGTVSAQCGGVPVYRGVRKDGPGHWIVSYSTDYLNPE